MQILQESHKFSRFLLFFYEFEEIDLDYGFDVPPFYYFTWPEMENFCEVQNSTGGKMRAFS
jgi:hypothetical protein